MDLIKPDGPDGKAVNCRTVDFVEQELTSWWLVLGPTRG